jgi:hypothetical protein
MILLLIKLKTLSLINNNIYHIIHNKKYLHKINILYNNNKLNLCVKYMVV